MAKNKRMTEKRMHALWDIVDKKKPLSCRQSVELLREVCDGMSERRSAAYLVDATRRQIDQVARTLKLLEARDGV